MLARLAVFRGGFGREAAQAVTGADLPLLLIFAGVIGGLIAFGIVGIFVGPVVLAVAYTLLDSWIATDTREKLVPLNAGTGTAQ